MGTGITSSSGRQVSSSSTRSGCQRRPESKDDALRSGRVSYDGTASRGAARSLARELERKTGSRPWVQAIVAIWGEFPQDRVTQNEVTYLRATELVDWLNTQPPRYTEARTRSLLEALEKL
jgi:hypothetical protein